MSTANRSIWKACVLIFACEVAERVGFYAISSNLVIYLRTRLHEDVAVAARNVNNWGGTTFLTPFLGAFVAESFLGRYLAIALFCSMYFMALVLVTLAVSLDPLKPPDCDSSLSSSGCEKATKGQLVFFYFALYLMALGAGGVKASVTAFAGDQFDEGDAKQRQLKLSFMNWWWMSLSIGILISVGIFPWVQENVGWFWVAAIPAVISGVVTFGFIFGKPLYKHRVPSGSAFTRIVQVLVVAVKHWRVVVEDNTPLFDESYPDGYKLAHTKSLRFLDKAAVPSAGSGAESIDSSPWNLCTVTQVEEVKLLIHVLPVWTSNLMNSAVFAQVGTLFINQGTTMNRSMGPHFTVPPASLILLISLTICIFLPLYDRILVPIARDLTGNHRGISMLQRIGVGLVISILAMAVAAVVERKRLEVAKQHGLLDSPSAILPMSVFWLVPQYCLVGLYEVFIVVGQNDFFYHEAPQSMRSIGTALFFSNNAVGSFISSALVTGVNDVTRNSTSGDSWIGNNLNRSHIDYFYWFIAILSAIFFLFFLVCAHFYRYNVSEEETDNLFELTVRSGSTPSIQTTEELFEL